MTADLELYLRGLYRNRWPCMHKWFDRFYKLEFVCSICGMVKTYREIYLETR